MKLVNEILEMLDRVRDDYNTVYFKNKNLKKLEFVVSDLKSHFSDGKVEFDLAGERGVNVYVGRLDPAHAAKKLNNIVSFIRNEMNKSYGVEISDISGDDVSF